MSRAACRECKKPIVWARSSATGKVMPVDPDPAPTGNVRLVEGAAHVLGSEAAAAARAAGEGLYLSHFATCPNAQQFRP